MRSPTCPRLSRQVSRYARITGLRIGIAPGNYRIRRRGKWRDVPGMVTVQVGTSAAGLHREEAWHYLNGVDAGARAAKEGAR